jgi:hypothetical protein
MSQLNANVVVILAPLPQSEKPILPVKLNPYRA